MKDSHTVHTSTACCTHGKITWIWHYHVMRRCSKGIAAELRHAFGPCSHATCTHRVIPTDRDTRTRIGMYYASRKGMFEQECANAKRKVAWSILTIGNAPRAQPANEENRLPSVQDHKPGASLVNQPPTQNCRAQLKPACFETTMLAASLETDAKCPPRELQSISA